MSHQALARKHRPRSFADVATQEHVSETLRRAVATDRVGHAYLFCGPRGVGKTTLARVLAMALNCPRRGDDGEPCGECESCTRIWGGHTALDVVEIDAASNRGVDDARDLRERAMYAPSEEGRYKVYIVDEAHMLTREAWNALLKILEEPPPRVIFVFATTEPQKIQQSAAPILSRCQRFDFRRIGVQDIVDRLGQVLEREGSQAPVDALRILARKADGGMRDALSLLDQVLALTGGEVGQDAVRSVLGLVEEERYLELFGILADGRHGDVFGFVERLLDDGYDLGEFYHGLVDTLRALLRLSLTGGEDAPELREDLRPAFAEHAARFQAADLVRMLAMASELESSGSLRGSAQPRLLLEMLLLRLSWMDRTVDLEALVRGLGGAPPADGSAGGGAGDREGRAAGDAVEPGGVAPPATAGAASLRDAFEAALAPGAASGPTDAPAEAEVASVGAPPSGPADPVDPVGPLDPVAAWERILDSGGVPGGLTTLLRAARARPSGDDGLRLSVPPGPASERLADPSVRRALEGHLRDVAGRPVELVVEVEDGPGAGSSGRITRETVLQGRLDALLEKEPLLRRAVEALDLELME